MDDIFQPLDQNALNELTSEPMTPQSVPPQPAQAQQPAPQPMARPMGRTYAQPMARRPMMQPTAQPQPSPYQSPAPTGQSIPVQPTQFQPQNQPAAPNQPMAQQATIAPAAAPAVGVPAPGFQRPQTAPQTQPPPTPVSANPPTARPARGHGILSKFDLPKGVYIIIGLTLFDILVAFASGNTSGIYTFAVLINFLLAAALFTKINRARQAVLVFQGLNMLLIVFALLGYMGNESRLNQLATQYNDAVAQVSVHASPQQVVAVDNLNTLMNKERHQIGKAIGIDYFRSSLAVVVSLATLWYLTRPYVKEAFH